MDDRGCGVCGHGGHGMMWVDFITLLVSNEVRIQAVQLPPGRLVQLNSVTVIGRCAARRGSVRGLFGLWENSIPADSPRFLLLLAEVLALQILFP